ncbi:hypothetical protein BDQ17DRAFT_1437306 [Cyathus striatus]|nr:hypothetical protein BDQ17DRAFT_1437306 [Cyathus striatus]
MAALNGPHDKLVHLHVVKIRKFMGQLNATETLNESNMVVGAGPTAQPSARSTPRLPSLQSPRSTSGTNLAVISTFLRFVTVARRMLAQYSRCCHSLVVQSANVMSY